MGRKSGKKAGREGQQSHLRVARLAVLRNLLFALIIAAGAVLIVLLVLRYSTNTSAVTSAAVKEPALPPDSSGPPDSATLPEQATDSVEGKPILSEDGLAEIYPGSEGEIRDYSEAELAAGFDITLACGCRQKYKWRGPSPAYVNGKAVMPEGPGPKLMIERSKRRSCQRCQQLLDFKVAASSTGAAGAGK